jgi:uncharacterized protein (TIGR03067 family)
MRLAYICCLLGTLTTTALADDKADAKKDLKALEGNWDVESLVFNGEELKDKYKLSFVFKEDSFTIEGDDNIKKEYGKFKIKLDPSTNPKCMDFTVSLGNQKDLTLEGLYEVKGDDLRLCFRVGKDRPTEFKSAENSNTALVTLKRQK